MANTTPWPFCHSSGQLNENVCFSVHYKAGRCLCEEQVRGCVVFDGVTSCLGWSRWEWTVGPVRRDELPSAVFPVHPVGVFLGSLFNAFEAELSCAQIW